MYRRACLRCRRFVRLMPRWAWQELAAARTIERHHRPIWRRETAKSAIEHCVLVIFHHWGKALSKYNDMAINVARLVACRGVSLCP